MSLKKDEEWEKILTPEQFRVCRQKGTEEPFSGEHLRNMDNGDYLCVCCSSKLFESSTKFDSGCGWPAFNEACGANGSDLLNSSIEWKEDNSLDTHRTEVTCKNCEAHLGHVFTDGPAPTGLRYCINSVSLKFKRR